jgi:hypothetical protein
MPAKQKGATPTSAPAAKKQPPAKPHAPASAASKRAPAATAVPVGKKYSALEAAAQVLRESGQPLSCPELIQQMAAQGYWSSPKGQTPAATLYAALAREVQRKGDAARFVKTGPGRFAYRRTP